MQRLVSKLEYWCLFSLLKEVILFLQPAIAFSIREQLYEVRFCSFFELLCVYYATFIWCKSCEWIFYMDSLTMVFFVFHLPDCSSKCSISKRKQNKQKGTPRGWVYSSQVCVFDFLKIKWRMNKIYFLPPPGCWTQFILG